jgi:tetratricopeptide (TPR) repeat protein
MATAGTIAMSEGAANPIEKELAKVEACWTTFAEKPKARILRWVPDDDARQMIQLFVDLESEPVGTTPDLFLELNAPFESQTTYAAALIEDLKSQYAANRESIAETGITSEWQVPVCSSDCPVSEMLKTFDSFHQAFPSLARFLVLVLSPESRTSSRQWEQWWLEIIRQRIPESLRLMVVDSPVCPELGKLSEASPELVITISPELDMSSAYEEIVATIPGSGPGFDFRKFFVALTNAAGTGNTAKAESIAGKAIAIATAEKWYYLISATQMALGAAYFAAGQLPSAVAAYRQANAAISGADDVASRNMELPTRMAEGAALIAAGDFPTAADVYQNAALVAEKQNQPSAELECWRMAGWCFESAKKPEQSWECGEKALMAGARIQESDRVMSTLPYAGQMLLRLADAGTNRRRKSEIAERMTELMGAEWTDSLVTGAT